MKKIKQTIKKIPVIGKFLLKIHKLLFNGGRFPGSESYWEQRYVSGETSGAGSYNRLAEFKADVINSFVAGQKISSVIEFGCGDGNQLSLANYPSYIGLDVSPTAIKMCTTKFYNDKSKSFFLYNSTCFIDNHKLFKAEVSLSLDVLYHLIEDDIFHNYLEHLFNSSEKYVIIYASNYETKQTYHEKDRKFTEWIEKNQSDWHLIKKIENRYPFNPKDLENTSKADFFIYGN